MWTEWHEFGISDLGYEDAGPPVVPEMVPVAEILKVSTVTDTTWRLGIGRYYRDLKVAALALPPGYTPWSLARPAAVVPRRCACSPRPPGPACPMRLSASSRPARLAGTRRN
jgi:hypothetical protein